jgi:hypothetical protein
MSLQKKASPRWQLPNVAIASIGVSVVVICIGGLLLFSHLSRNQPGANKIACPAISQPEIISTATTQATSGIIGQATTATDQGVTIQVEHAFADAFSLSVSVGISSTGTTVEGAVLNDATLADTTGTISDQSSGGGGSILDPTHSLFNIDYPALMPDQLQQPLHLILTVHHMTLNMGKPLPGSNNQLTGTWQSTFTLQPIPDHYTPIHMTPAISQGICLQVQSLEYAPPEQTNFSSDGGVRLMLTLSHIPSNILLSSFEGWYPLANPTLIRSCPSGGCPPQPTPTSAVLTLSGFTQSIPQMNPRAISSIMDPPVSSNLQTVGPSGTVHLALLYSGQGIPTSSATGKLIITNLHLFVASEGKTQTPQPTITATLPTWQIVFP